MIGSLEYAAGKVNGYEEGFVWTRQANKPFVGLFL